MKRSTKLFAPLRHIALGLVIAGSAQAQPPKKSAIQFVVCENRPKAPPQPVQRAAPTANDPAWKSDEVLRGLFGLNATDPWDQNRAGLAELLERGFGLAGAGGGSGPVAEMKVPPQVDQVMTLVTKMLQLPPESKRGPDNTLPLAMAQFQDAAPSIPGSTLPDKLRYLRDARARAGVPATPTERMQTDAVIDGLQFFVNHYPTLRSMVGNDLHLTTGDANASLDSLLGQVEGIILSGVNPATGGRLPLGVGAILRGRNRRLGYNPLLERKMEEMSAGPRQQIFEKLLSIIGSDQPADPGPHAPNFYDVKRMGEEAQVLGQTFQNAFGLSAAGLGGGGGGPANPMDALRMFVDGEGLNLAPIEDLYNAAVQGRLPTSIRLPSPPPRAPAQGVAKGVPGKQVYIAAGGNGATSSYGYLVSLPKNYSADKKYDVAVYLHGVDSRGAAPGALEAMGLAAAVNRYRASGGDVNAIVVTPILPANGAWDAADINRLQSDMVKQYGHDASRTFIMGHSLGGIGALAAGHDGQWNKVVSTSGVLPYPDPFGMTKNPAALAAWAQSFQSKDVLVRYGTDDAVVRPDLQAQTAQAILAANPERARVQPLPGVGHTTTLNEDYVNAALAAGWMGDAFKDADHAYAVRTGRSH